MRDPESAAQRQGLPRWENGSASSLPLPWGDRHQGAKGRTASRMTGAYPNRFGTPMVFNMLAQGRPPPHPGLPNKRNRTPKGYHIGRRWGSTSLGGRDPSRFPAAAGDCSTPLGYDYAGSATQGAPATGDTGLIC